MPFEDEAGKKMVALEFTAATLPPSLALIELVRHLARISAENDYKAFLKSIESRYSGPQPKGSLS